MQNVRKAIIRVFLVVFIMIALQETVRFCYESWNSITIWSKKERKELEGTLDTLYLGTSIVYDGIVPSMLDAELGTNSFNMGSAGQPVIGSYYLLLEAAEKNPIKQVYMSIPMPSLLKADAYLQNYLSAFENLYTLEWKLKYLSAVNKEEVWKAALFYSTQVEYYLVPQKVKTNIIKKLNPQDPPELYGGRGFRHSTSVFKGRKQQKNNIRNTWFESGNEERLQAQALTYLDKMAEFCKENDIELTLIGMPYPQVFIDGAGNMDGYHEYLQSKAEELGVEFYDFIYHKEREEIFTNETFKDDHHLNTIGGEAFSRMMIEVLQSDNPQEYFYDSLAEFEAK